MESLVALGSTASFGVGLAAAMGGLLRGGLVAAAAGGGGGAVAAAVAAAPLLLTADASFLEEPVMLLAFVLLGRALEARAKVGSAGDAGRGG